MSSPHLDNPFADPPAEPTMGAAASAAPASSVDAGHPVARSFHILFKALAIGDYLLCSAIFPNTSFVVIFVSVVLLLVADFWTTKNVTGRLLVGLRWWNQIKEDGTSAWVFESQSDPNWKPHARDSQVFWWAIYITPAIWGLFALVAMLKMNLGWLLVIITALALNVSNVIGYWKCNKDNSKKLKGMIQQGALRAMMA